MDTFKKSAEFRNVIRSQLNQKIIDHNYKLIYDNDALGKSDTKRWVFKLIYQGKNKIQISNSDWRDYTEYFEIYINDIEIKSLNIFDYKNLEEAFSELEKIIFSNL